MISIVVMKGRLTLMIHSSMHLHTTPALLVQHLRLAISLVEAQQRLLHLFLLFLPIPFGPPGCLFLLALSISSSH
jgi:hypothetical protein